MCGYSIIRYPYSEYVESNQHTGAYWSSVKSFYVGNCVYSKRIKWLHDIKYVVIISQSDISLERQTVNGGKAIDAIEKSQQTVLKRQQIVENK